MTQQVHNKLVSFIWSIAIQEHQDFESKVANNADKQNSDLALKRIIEDVMRKQRKNELDLYRLYAKDDAFYQAFFDTMKRMVSMGESRNI